MGWSTYVLKENRSIRDGKKKLKKIHFKSTNTYFFNGRRSNHFDCLPLIFVIPPHCGRSFRPNSPTIFPVVFIHRCCCYCRFIVSLDPTTKTKKIFKSQLRPRRRIRFVRFSLVRFGVVDS